METLRLSPIYSNRKSGLGSGDMRAVCRDAGVFELDLDSPSGFARIVAEKNPGFARAERLRDVPKDEGMTLTQAAQGIIDGVTNYLIKNWPRKGRIIFNMSGGADSRIIAYCVRDLYAAGILSGDITFVAHGREAPLARKVIISMGWSKDQFHIHREGADIDVYDWGPFHENVNAFWPPGLGFHSEVVDDKSQHTVVTGNMGNWFSYPGYQTGFTGERWADYLAWAKAPIMSLAAPHAQWKAELSPFLSMEVIEHGCRIPEHLYVWDKVRERDSIRHRALELLGDENEIHVKGGPRYNLAFSADFRLAVFENYTGSKLYQDFPEVRQYVPSAEIGRITTATKLYGLSTMYEGI